MPWGSPKARLVAARLRGLPFHFDSITSSTMTRARETATIIHDSLNEVDVRRFGALQRVHARRHPEIPG